MSNRTNPADGVARVTKIALDELIRIAEDGQQLMLAYLLGMARDECLNILSDQPQIGSPPHDVEEQHTYSHYDNWHSKNNMH